MNKLLFYLLLTSPSIAMAHGITEEFVYCTLFIFFIVPMVSFLLSVKGQRLKTLLIHLPIWVVWLVICAFLTGLIAGSMVSLLVLVSLLPIVSWSYLIYRRVNK